MASINVQSKSPLSSRVYKLYAINFHTNSLSSIREEFRRRVQLGDRRRVIVIDLEEEKKLLALKVRNTQRFDDFTVALAAIERCCNEYANMSRKIEEENKFNLIDYWLGNLNVSTGATLLRKSSVAIKKGPVKSAKAPDTSAPEKRPKGSRTATNKKSVISFPVCPQLVPKEHNTVGRPPMLSKRRYIQDEPEQSKLFIIIIGDMDNDFYLKLLSKKEPLEAIVHFLPEESGYDLLLPHPETKELLARTIEEIQEEIFEMRPLAITKSTGYMQHYLPVISRCLAEKYTQQIYDQLSYYLYDIELLYQQYQHYYIEPFRITNVAMPAGVNVQGLQEIAESLTMQGAYINAPLPGVAGDQATISMYLEGLLNQIAQRARKLTPQQAQLTTLPYTKTSCLDLNMDLRDVYTTAFDSILKVKYFERLCIAENNELLHELLLYTNTASFERIHYTSLEYNAMRAYIDNSRVENVFKIQAYEELSDRDLFPLPYYAKLYFGENTVKQHLQNWLVKYNTYEVDEIMPGCKLYHFKCNYNEVYEEQEVAVLPSPLCFRDFTLFQMEAFLEALVTPEMLKTQDGPHKIDGPTKSFTKQSTVETNINGLDLSIFIRPTSLKWQKVRRYMESQFSRATGSTFIPKQRATQISMRKETSKMNAVPGLPRDHPLLKGYNLEDIRQEIQIKNSSYYFQEGALELYEERWCFTDMNKNLLFTVNGNVFNIFRPRFWNTCVSPCLRFTNKNNISVRVLNKEEECAKIVINYPNGLAIYHHETYAEQEWYTGETVNGEQRRMYVAEGAVIVHYQSEDLIMVMRYNGEVYRLYQYEFPEGEEEELNEMTEELDPTLKIELRDSTANRTTTRRTQRASKKEKEMENQNEKEKANEKEETATFPESVRVRSGAVSAKKSRSSKLSDGSTLQKSIVLEERVKRKTAKNLLIESIDNELKFLNELSNKYGLTYLHLIVTTSMGLIINLTHRGKVYKGHSSPTLEWHDYFTNESYAQRGDGVRMIWTADSLKCYHEDGTVLITTQAEKIELFSFDTETAITQSSSHMEEEYDGGGDFDDSSTNHLLIEGRYSKDSKIGKKPAPLKPLPRSIYTRARVFNTFSQYLMHGGEGEEEHRIDDPSYVTYRNDSFNVLHKRYAEVKIELYEVPINNIVVSIMAIDGIYAYIYKEIPVRENVISDDYNEIPSFTNAMGGSATGSTQMQVPVTKSSSIHTDGIELRNSADLSQTIEQEIIVQTVVKVSFGNDFSMSTTEDACELTMDLERYDEEKGKVLDTLEIRFDYVKNIADLFQYFVDQISKFKNYQKPQSKEFYFLEHQNAQCNITGFRFVCDLPKSVEYSFSASNTFTELKKLNNINEKMTNDYPWFDKDMKKFPRFLPLKKERVPPINETFPLVLLTNMYVKIPPQLCNTAEIHKFVEPIEDFTFKKTERYLRDALEYYLRPRIRIELARLWSANNWKLKHEKHKQRLVREQQRTGLYKAMLRHNVFPKYKQFSQEFDSHVKNIDFFQFVILRCYKPEKVEDERLAKEQKFKKKIGRDKTPAVITPSEPQKSPDSGLQWRYSKAKYRGRNPPKCITTLTHTTADLDA
ncbi:uncharacterized protein LOC129240815 [Anastrepha obliqua]|uniref:uncharacterized protein LOC129240815 n=1 Tax=Anastrepha obliqua TaxID=95512 RepID=UPI0024091E68|nr:uncharacterized protein LOC129240815 [Anastrepha obliqua]